MEILPLQFVITPSYISTLSCTGSQKKKDLQLLKLSQITSTDHVTHSTVILPAREALTALKHTNSNYQKTRILRFQFLALLLPQTVTGREVNMSCIFSEVLSIPQNVYEAETVQLPICRGTPGGFHTSVGQLFLSLLS